MIAKQGTAAAAEAKAKSVWDTMPSPAWGVDPQGPGSAAAAWSSVPPNPMTKAPAPARPPCPTFAEHERSVTKAELESILARKAGQAEALVQQTKNKNKSPPPVDGERSAASIKRARQKEARSLAASAASGPYLPTGLAGSSNGLRPPSPAGSFVIVSEAEAEDEDEDAKEERELLARMQALKLKKAAAAAAATVVVVEKEKYQDESAGAAVGKVKPVILYQSACVGVAGGSEPIANPAGLAVKPPMVKHKKDQGPRMETSGRRIVKGVGKKAAESKGVGSGKVMSVDPYQFVCVGLADGSEPELGGSSSFYPPRDLPEEEKLAAMKILTCCNCGDGPLKQSSMVLCGGGKGASWQGKVFGWCRACMPDLTDQEFKSQSRITWNFRIHEAGKTRERAMFTEFENALSLIRSDFPGVSQTVARELAVKRTKAMCCAWAASMEKENVHLQAARQLAHDDYITNIEREAACPEYACSVDGRVLKAREISWLTNVAEGISLSFCCRRPDCLYYGMNSQWLNLSGSNRFRCPVCIDEYKPTSTTSGQVEFSFVLAMTDFTTGRRVAIPAMWPEGKDMAWLNKNIEAFSLSIASEVELANYVQHGKADLHKLLSEEAVPAAFGRVPFASHPNADINRMWGEPRWCVDQWQARGYTEGARLNPAVDDLTHPYSNWTEFIAICGRITAEGRVSAAEVARRMGD
jgi:hypothetical protein